ncbi:hypothetical protein [Polynucleobacter sp.]|uniref:hypothetical protein n=1 Tax=Polynucleobacter sp. TaxID=2029855 RepID=UPI003F6A00EC
MFQTEKLIAAQAKAIESAQVLAQLAIENAKAVADIHYDATKDAVVATQVKAAQILTIKDAKEALEIFTADEAQAVLSELSAIQGKVSKVISKSNKEVVDMIESAMDESKLELKKMVKEISNGVPTSAAPAISAFDYVFDAAVQGFDQAYAVSKDAYTSFEKTIESSLNLFQDQYVPSKKAAPKKQKAIAA